MLRACAPAALLSSQSWKSKCNHFAPDENIRGFSFVDSTQESIDIPNKWVYNWFINKPLGTISKLVLLQKEDLK